MKQVYAGLLSLVMGCGAAVDYVDAASYLPSWVDNQLTQREELREASKHADYDLTLFFDGPLPMVPTLMVDNQDYLVLKDLHKFRLLPVEREERTSVIGTVRDELPLSLGMGRFGVYELTRPEEDLARQCLGQSAGGVHLKPVMTP
jgi:hypothetical protein